MARKIWRVSRIILITLFVFLGILFLLWWINSPGTADPIKDESGKPVPKSISVIDTVTLGGLKQYLIIRGADSTKPVVLFVHGGPGGPEGVMMKAMNPEIEREFVMVYWEQRGSGKSYAKNIPAETMNLDQFVRDADQLSIYLRKRFQRDKIFIMGHSWGSLLGLLTAYRHPEHYYAYFGIGQIAGQYRGEYASYQWVKEQAHVRNDTIGIRELGAIRFPDSPSTNKVWDDFLGVERNYVMKYGGGATHEMTSILPFVKMIFLAHEYTIPEKLNYVRASDYSMQFLWPEVIRRNLTAEIDSVRIPVYVLQGRFDYQTPFPVAKEFLQTLKAPDKDFITFEQSAHSPNMEETKQFNTVVKALAEKALHR